MHGNVHYLPRPHRTAEDEAAQKRRRKIKAPSLVSIRAAELNRFFSYQYGEIIPGIHDDVVVTLNVLAMATSPISRITNWLEWRAPWFDDDDLVDDIIRDPKWLKADAIAKKIGLTITTRKLLKIRTIGAIDISAAARAKIRAARKVAAKRKKRREAGMTPRDEWERYSLQKQKPWVTLGVSRRSWYRNHRKTEHSATVGTDLTPNNSSLFSGVRTVPIVGTRLTITEGRLGAPPIIHVERTKMRDQAEQTKDPRLHWADQIVVNRGNGAMSEDYKRWLEQHNHPLFDEFGVLLSWKPIPETKH